MHDPDCIFCRIAAGQIPASIVYQDDRIVAFADIRPAAPFHFLIIPRDHIPTLNAVGGDNEAVAGRMVAAAGEIARRHGFAEAGYRLVGNCNRAAGQEIFHLHLHLFAGLDTMGWPPF